MFVVLVHASGVGSLWCKCLHCVHGSTFVCVLCRALRLFFVSSATEFINFDIYEPGVHAILQSLEGVVVAAAIHSLEECGHTYLGIMYESLVWWCTEIVPIALVTRLFLR